MRKILFAVFVSAGAALPVQAHEIGAAHNHPEISTGDLTTLVIQALAAVTVGVFALAITGVWHAGGNR